MRSRRTLAAALSAIVLGSGIVLVAPGVASADGPTPVEATCSGLPIVGSTTATANVNATDDVDPVDIGGVVNNTLNVPIPAVEVPVEVTVKEVKIVVPIPAGVTVDDVTFTASSFTGQSWSVSGSNLTATFTGNVVIANGGPTPVVPDVKMKTTVAGPARTIEWKAPTSITAKASYFLGNFTASCTPTNPNLVLISTVVRAPNTAPTATDQAVPVAHNTAKAITLSGTDPESNPLTFATTSTPAHGVLSGTAPNITYTPTTGYSGPDSFTFTASDGALSDTGTISLTVAPAPNTAPTATDQAVPVTYNTAKAITLSGTDPESNPLTFATTSTPAHGVLSGTAPNITYTPTTGYSGPDSFTFTASDGALSDTGTISLTVAGPTATVPGAPTIGAATASEGEAAIAWSAPASTGGSPITGYKVTPYANGTAKPVIDVPAGTTSTTVTGLANGVAHTFKVAAVNAVGTGPDSAASTAVTPQWWLPWSSGSVAVTEIFTWLTGKAPTNAEKTSWLSQLDGGTKLPSDLVVALRGGTDATTNVDPTVRLYSAYLNRIPDAGGLNFWLNRRRNGWTLSRISNNFATSTEFVRRYGALTNRKFVENIYSDVLQRAGDPAGITYWTKKLDAKTATRGQVMINFSESNEYKTKQVNKTSAAVVFIHLRGKTPTTVERDAFVAALVGGTPLKDLIRDQIHLPAFAGRAG